MWMQKAVLMYERPVHESGSWYENSSKASGEDLIYERHQPARKSSMDIVLMVFSVISGCYLQMAVSHESIEVKKSSSFRHKAHPELKSAQIMHIHYSCGFVDAILN